MSQKKVTVITSFYNEEKHLERAIYSILNQTYENIELILVNDYSTDSSPGIARAIQDSRVKFIDKKTEPNGVASSRRLAIEHATGDFLTFQDADDTSEIDRIEKQLSLLLSLEQKTIVGCGIKLIRGKKKENRIFPFSNNEICKGFNRCFNRVTMVGATLLGPIDLFRAIPFRIQYKYMEDWDQLLRLHESKICMFSNHPEALYNYFLNEETSTTTNPERIRYNVFLRYNEIMRKRGLEEFTSCEEFFKQLKIKPVKFFQWLLFYNLKKTQHHMRNFL